MRKKFVIGLTIAVVIGIGTYAFGHWEGSYGYGGWMHGGYGMHQGYYGDQGSGYGYRGDLIDHMIKIRKISLDAGRGYAAMGPTMGYGSQYPESCWQ